MSVTTLKSSPGVDFRCSACWRAVNASSVAFIWSTTGPSFVIMLCCTAMNRLTMSSVSSPLEGGVYDDVFATFLSSAAYCWIGARNARALLKT